MTTPRTRRLTLWVASSNTEPHPVEMEDRVRLSATAGQFLTPAGPCVPTDAAVTLQTVEPIEGVVAVAFVVNGGHGHVALNGVPATTGMYPLRPTDRIDVALDSYWLSEDLSPDRTTYDPAVHGPDARCCMTKARLKTGHAIVVCPGRPGVPCGAIYQAVAWDAVIQSNREMKCPHCGYRPGAPTWRPSTPRPRKEMLDDLRDFIQK